LHESDIRAALTELAARDDVEKLVQLVYGLRFTWTIRGHLHEGLEWAAEARRRAASSPLAIQARTWECEASFALRLGDTDRASELFQDARAAYGSPELADRTSEAWCMYMLAWIAL
jgi:hypothetical protein